MYYNVLVHVLHHTTLYYTCSRQKKYTVLHCTILYYAVLRCTTLYYVVLRCTTLYFCVLVNFDYSSERQ